MPRFQIVSATGTYKTIKLKNQGVSVTKGALVLLTNLIAFTFDAYLAGSDHIVVYQCDQVLVTALGVGEGIEALEFEVGQFVYWSIGNEKLTTSNDASTLIGYALEAKDLSGGVSLGTTLLIEFIQGVES